MGLSASRGSRVIEKMIKKGYPRREENESDRRQALISLTDDGRALKERIDALMRSCEDKILEQIEAADVADAKRTLRNLINIFEKDVLLKKNA
jgi:DNA-binding MarR family transcriptional regulator